MISKVLWYIERGVKALRQHTKFIFLILLLFVFPFAVLQIAQKNDTVTLQNMQTSQKEAIAITHQAAWLTEILTEEDKLVEILQELNSPAVFSIYRVAENYELLRTSSIESGDVKNFFLDSAPLSKSPYIFEEIAHNERFWYAVSRQEIDGISYILLTQHNVTNIDTLIASRKGQTYGVLLAGLTLLLLIAYWLIKQINWEAQYHELESKMKEQELLISTITHEFRAPLTAIKGYLSFLFESNRLRPKDRDALVRVSLSSERLLHLVNDFLEVAKIQSGNLDLKVKKVSLAQVIYRVISELGSTAKEKQLVLRDATQNPNITLTTDEGRLLQILTNIINNALKYTERGSVVITYEQNPLYVVLRVQDTGTGISAEDQQKLFKPFSRVGGVEKTTITGSGLGMWITKKLVEFLGGGIAIESIKGVGTHVVIKFDLRKIAAKTRDGIL